MLCPSACLNLFKNRDLLTKVAHLKAIAPRAQAAVISSNRLEFALERVVFSKKMACRVMGLLSFD